MVRLLTSSPLFSTSLLPTHTDPYPPPSSPLLCLLSNQSRSQTEDQMALLGHIMRSADSWTSGAGLTWKSPGGQQQTEMSQRRLAGVEWRQGPAQVPAGHCFGLMPLSTPEANKSDFTGFDFCFVLLLSRVIIDPPPFPSSPNTFLQQPSPTGPWIRRLTKRDILVLPLK